MGLGTSGITGNISSLRSEDLKQYRQMTEKFLFAPPPTQNPSPNPRNPRSQSSPLLNIISPLEPASPVVRSPGVRGANSRSLSDSALPKLVSQTQTPISASMSQNIIKTDALENKEECTDTPKQDILNDTQLKRELRAAAVPETVMSISSVMLNQDQEMLPRLTNLRKSLKKESLKTRDINEQDKNIITTAYKSSRRPALDVDRDWKWKASACWSIVAHNLKKVKEMSGKTSFRETVYRTVR